MGSPGARAVLLVTKTLLFAGEGSSGAPIFRAYDKKTGAIVWETTVPTGTVQSLPMTYVHNGRQYIVFASGGPQMPAQSAAYSLPPPPAPAGQRGAPQNQAPTRRHSPPWPRRGGRDINKNVAKPPLMERTGWLVQPPIIGG